MRVVIVGGGFAGVRTAIGLTNKQGFEVKLISSKAYFEYHAALYRSATGRSPLEVAIPLEDFFDDARNVEVVEDTITEIDKAAKSIIGENGSKYPYDVLVMALGNVTYYGEIKGLSKYSLGVKTVQEALGLKRHLHEQLLGSNGEKNYVVVGAGATGVELAAELTSYIKQIRKCHDINRPFTVNLIDIAPRPLASLGEDFSKVVQDRLNELKIKTLYNTPVKSETASSINLPKGSIESHTVIWTAGSATNPLFKRFPDVFEISEKGRVKVDSHLKAAKDIYVLGDSAETKYSGMAQTALNDAKFLTSNLIRMNQGEKPQTYLPKQPVYAIPVGEKWAAVKWGRFKFYGRIGWFVRRLADLSLYIKFLPLSKALVVWRYGQVKQEVCEVCD